MGPLLPRNSSPMSRLGRFSWYERNLWPAAAFHGYAKSLDQDQTHLDAEQKLCAEAARGDRAALGTLLRTHGPRLYRSVLLPRLGNSANAEEALSQVYVKVVQNFAQFQWQNVGLYPWLRTIALHVALDQLRRDKRLRLFAPEDLERELDRDASTPGDELERLDLLAARSKVDQALEGLNPRYARVIRGRVLEERSREELAAELEVSVATFDVLLHRALAALKKAIQVGEVVI